MKIGDMNNFERDTFRIRDVSMYFAMRLGQLINEDPKNRPTCT